MAEHPKSNSIGGFLCPLGPPCKSLVKNQREIIASSPEIPESHRLKDSTKFGIGIEFNPIFSDLSLRADDDQPRRGAQPPQSANDGGAEAQEAPRRRGGIFGHRQDSEIDQKLVNQIISLS